MFWHTIAILLQSIKYNDMKFYELIEKVDFDKLPFCNGAKYRCIYDMLRHTEADINDDDIYVTWMDSPAGENDGEITVSNCDVIWDTGDHIQQLAHHLGKDIVVEDDIKLSDEELLAKILWELTFFGFSPKDYSYDVSRKPVRNKYDKAYLDMKYRRNKRYMDRFDRKEYLEYGFDCNWRYYYYQRKNRKMPVRGNRSKRKRDFRQKNRLKFYKKMGDIEAVMQMFLADGSTFTREQLGWLSNTENIHQRLYRSYTYGEGNRLDYLYSLLTKYKGYLFEDEYYAPVDNTKPPRLGDWDDKKYTGFVVTLNVSPEYPLTEDERAVYEKIIALTPKENIIVGTGYDRSLGPEAEIISLSTSRIFENEPYLFDFEGRIRHSWQR